MGKVSCKQCGQSIFDTEATCPWCGAVQKPEAAPAGSVQPLVTPPRRAPSRSRNVIGLLAILLAVAAATGGLWFVGRLLAEQEPANAPIALQQVEVLLDMSRELRPGEHLRGWPEGAQAVKVRVTVPYALMTPAASTGQEAGGSGAQASRKGYEIEGGEFALVGPGKKAYGIALWNVESMVADMGLNTADWRLTLYERTGTVQSQAESFVLAFAVPAAELKGKFRVRYRGAASQSFRLSPNMGAGS